MKLCVWLGGVSAVKQGLDIVAGLQPGFSLKLSSSFFREWQTQLARDYVEHINRKGLPDHFYGKNFFLEDIEYSTLEVAYEHFKVDMHSKSEMALIDFPLIKTLDAKMRFRTKKILGLFELDHYIDLKLRDVEL